MVTVYRAKGLRIAIFANDHPPPHVHVIGDGMAKIELMGPDGKPRTIGMRGMTRAEHRRAVELVIGERAFLIAAWRKLHG